MSAIEELEKRIEKEGVVQLSGGIFKAFTTSKGIVKANTTVHKYCEAMCQRPATPLSEATDYTPEEYAKNILDIFDARHILIIGECMNCNKFITEEDELGDCDYCNSRIKAHMKSVEINNETN